MDPNSEDTRNFMRAWVAKNYPEDAAALGLKVNSADNPLTQLGNELGVSGGSMVSGLEGALDWITGNKSQDDWGGQKFTQDLRSNYSLESLSDVADDNLSVWDIWRGVTESAAPIALGAVTGGAAGLAAKGLGAAGAVQTGVGIGAAAASEAAIGAGSSFNNVFQGIINQKDDPNGQVQNSDEYARAYKAAFAKTGDAQTARDMAWKDVAYGQASLAAPGAAVANAVPALIGGTVLQKAISPIINKAARGPLKFASDSPIGKQAQDFVSQSKVRPFAAPIGQGLKVAAAEGVEEALQSGGETLAQNVAMGQVDPRVSPLEGVGEAALLGGLSGALGGGLVGGGLSAYANMQTNKDRNFSEGVVEREKIAEARRQAEEKNSWELKAAAGVAAYDERGRATAELAAKDKEAAKQDEYFGIQGTRYRPNAAPQDPTAVPRIGLDPTVSKPETFVYEPPFSQEVAKARGEVRSVIKNGERATIEKPVKQGKKTVVQKVSAAEEFDSIFAPDEKMSAAHKKVQAAESQYEYDRKSYNSLPENQKAGFKRHMADSRAQLNKAIKEYNGQRKAAEARLRSQANQWNKVAEANGLPQVKFGQRQETVGGKATGPSGALVKSQQSSAPVQSKPTADDYMTQAAELEDKLTRVSGRSFDMSLPEAERAAAKAESENIRAQLDEVNAAIEQSYGEAGSFDPSSILDESGAVNKNALRGEQQRAEQKAVLDFSDPAQRSVVEQEFEQDTQPVEPQQEATPSSAEATRLLDASQLPVERTDVKTPRLDQQGRENKLSDEYTYEVAPVSDKGTIDRFNENAATQDGSYTGAPTTGFKIVKTTKGLHGTNIGKPGRRTFATREEAEDFLANDSKIKDKVNIPKSAWDRKAAKDQEKAELDRERADEREAYLNLRAKAAFDRTYKELHDKLMTIAEEELRRVGLIQKGVKLATFDTQRKDAAGGDIGNQVYSMIREYNQNAMILGGAPMSNKAGTDLAKFDKGTQGAFIQWGNKANPLSIIALNRNLISPNMTPQQMKEAVNRVVHHELVHALVRGGFVTPQEYSALLRLARKRKMPGELGVDGGKITYLDYTKLAYRDQTEQVQEEEAIAELIALEGFGVSKTPMGGEVRGVIDRVVRVIKAIFGMLGDKDFRTFVDFMEGVKDGSVARRTLASIGFDPTNTLDPFGRNLGAARADMRVGLPMQAPTKMILEMRNKIIKHAKANKGRMPKGLSIGQIYGVPFIDMELKFKPDFSTEYFIARIPGAKSVQTRDRKVSRPDGSFDTVRDGYVTTATPENAVKLSDIIDLSDIQKYAPDIAKRLSEVGVISEMKPGKSIASVYHNKPEELSQKIFLNGQRTDVISLNARFIFGMRDMKEAQKFLAHEVQHLIDIYAGRGSFPVLSSMGSTAGEFSLDSRSPRMTPEQKARGATEAEFPSSEISRTLSYGNNLISSVVNAETLRVVEDMKRGLGDTMTGEMMDGYLRLQEAAQEFNHIFWEGLAPQASSAGPQLAKLQNMGSPDEARTTLQNEIGKLQSMSITNERKANAAIGEVLSELMQENPQASGFYSFVAQNLLTSQIFSTLMNVEQNLLNDVNSNTPFETMLGRQALYVVADDIARLLELNNSYRGEEGENKALQAESDDSNPAGVMERIRPVSNIANVNNPPSRWTEDQVNMAFPKLPVDDDMMQGMYENTGSKVFADSRINPTTEETSSKFMENITSYAKGLRADMRSGDMSALNGLNIQDVEVLMKVFKENPSVNIEEATKLLNARKKSERRPYRPNEVQGIVNRIAAINPDYARDGTNPEAILKYEKLWGTDRLKGVLAEATLGTPDVAIAKKFGLARASLRTALNEINVQPATPVAGITPELAARRVPEALVKRAFYRITKDSDQTLALTPESAFNANGHWNNARGPDFVRQEMLRSSEDGMEGRTLGQILDTLRKAGYKGGNTPVVNAFIKYETSIKERLDPTYYIGGNRANMKASAMIASIAKEKDKAKKLSSIRSLIDELSPHISEDNKEHFSKIYAHKRWDGAWLRKWVNSEIEYTQGKLDSVLSNDETGAIQKLSIHGGVSYDFYDNLVEELHVLRKIASAISSGPISGNRANMASGPTDDDGKVVSLNQRITDRDIARLEAERVKMGDRQREQMGELLGVPTTDIDIIQKKVFADLKKDVPFLWKKLNDGGEELVKTLSRQVKNIALAGPEGFRERTMRRVDNYKNLIEGEQDNRAGSAKLQNMIQFFEWVANKYSPNEPVGGNRADMRAGRNQIATPGRERKWIASKVDSKEWNDARRMLSKDEFDVYSTINDMANENGMLTREVLDEINQRPRGRKVHRRQHSVPPCEQDASERLHYRDCSGAKGSRERNHSPQGCRRAVC
ncbi:MAG: hypothetical protein B7Z37_23505 [Verrucomicrobia bacterium 12-59-8]|nr:MAG: hypothetical protein B7Z37_23505 [Verrucomicrobia bacterium 12-59-8]